VYWSPTKKKQTQTLLKLPTLGSKASHIIIGQANFVPQKIIIMSITLISNDNFEFIITREAASISGTLRNMLSSSFRESNEQRIKLYEFNGLLLGKIVEYLYYNLKYRNSVDVPEFDIPEEMALELLDASDFLDL
jgi:transcription elongation factor B subunit 1